MNRETEEMTGKVEEFLKQNGLKKKWFADKLGISPSALSQWLGGQKHFPEWRIAKMEEIISDKLI